MKISNLEELARHRASARARLEANMMDLQTTAEVRSVLKGLFDRWFPRILKDLKKKLKELRK